MSSIPPLLPQTNSLPFAGAVIQDFNTSTVEKNSHPSDDKMYSSTTDQAVLQQQASNVPSLIETLPIELREKIYGYLILDANVTTVAGESISIGVNETHTILTAKYHVNLFQVNKRLGAEAAKMFYNRNAFVVVLCTSAVGTFMEEARTAFPVTICEKSKFQSFEQYALKIELRLLNKDVPKISNPSGRPDRVVRAGRRKPGRDTVQAYKPLALFAVFAGHNLPNFVKLIDYKERRNKKFRLARGGYNLELSFGKDLSERTRVLLMDSFKGFGTMSSEIISIKGGPFVGKEKETEMVGAPKGRLEYQSSASEVKRILSGVEAALNVGDKVTAIAQLNMALSVLCDLNPRRDPHPICADIYFKHAMLASEMGLFSEALKFADLCHREEGYQGQRSRLLLCRAHVADLDAGSRNYYSARKVLEDALAIWPGNVEIQRLLARTNELPGIHYNEDVAAMKLKNPDKVLSKN